ncbi:TonB-dependent receptor [Flavobacterium subsaxonicum]|uniref:TonB-dependent receptor n=1 Tax=Flavobacterium subsaxonicum WB 4.1-42 = DSM 21790 TaxID=1121898 RepID=A0A0A2MKV0_9FLAO|nr:TonB-dependent receptor [Flavobacterium subsaxonicum]KGO93257.1 TonB-dependent receptor [Flavobacterium subsaxonicum WB 4.1-42 = DSM 21790]
MSKKIFLILIVFVCQYSFAQQDSIAKNNNLKEVVISSYHINDSLLNAPASVSILSTEQIQRNNLSDISPILNTLPGVFMQSGGINTNRISIRGIGARTPYGTNKIRAFYGSIPLTSGDSETTIEDIDLEIIDQVEVIKGPLSSLYGAGLGGAILLTPKLALSVNGSRGYVSSTHGSYGLVKNTIGYSLNTDSASLNLSYHKLETDGYRDNSHYNREGVTLAGELFRTQKSKLTYFGNYTYMKAFIPSSVNQTSFDTNPRAAAPTWAASKGYEQYDSYLGGLAYDWEATSWLKNSTSIFVNSKENYEPRPFDILSQNTTAYGARTQFFGDFKVGATKAQFIAGMEYFKDGFKGSTFENLYQDNNGNGSVQGNRITGTEQDRDFINAFAQLRVQLTKKFEIQAGVNYNKTQFSLDNTFPAESTSSEEYSYNGIWSPQVSLLYKPSALQTIYASVSRGFSLPSIEETLTADGTINPNIKPENGYNFEVGGKFYLANKNLYIELSAYRMQIKDLLVAQRVGDDQYIGINAGETLHQGIEAYVNYNWQISPDFALQPYAAASIGHYEFKEFINNDVDYSGNDLTGVPSNKVNGGITLLAPFGLYLSADYYYVDDIPLNDANSLYANSYNLLNAKAGWRFEILKGLTSHISAGVNNVTNTHYAGMVLVNATGVNGAQPRYYYPGLPVNYYGNVALSYSF